MGVQVEVEVESVKFWVAPQELVDDIVVTQEPIIEIEQSKYFWATPHKPTNEIVITK